MKKVISLVLVLIMLLAAVPVLAAETVTVGNIVYKIENGTARMTDYVGDGGEVVIPNEVEGYKVTAVADYAFEKRDDITKIVIPDSVNHLYKNAFVECNNLEMVVLGKGIVEIQSDTFHLCRIENLVILNPDIKIERGGIAEYTTGHGTPGKMRLPEGFEYTYIGTIYAPWESDAKNFAIKRKCNFVPCNSIEEIVKPDADFTYEQVNGGIKITGYYGNEECVVFPEEIDGNKVVELGEYIINHGWGGINTSVKEIVVPEGISVIPDEAFGVCEGVEKVTLPSTLKTIEASAFLGFSALKEINIPEGVETIERGAFYGCVNLTELNIPKGVDEINYVGEGCIRLEKFTVHPDNENYSSDEQGIVYNKDGTQIVEVPNGIKGIVYIPEGITFVPEDAFAMCENVTAVIFPKSMELLGHSSFARCTNLKTLVFYNPDTEILGGKVNEGMQLGSNRIKYPAFVATYPEVIYGYEGGKVYDEFKDSEVYTFLPAEDYEKNTSTASDWAKEYVNEAVGMGIVTDTLAENWTTAITREEFCEALVKTLAYYLDYDIEAFFEYVKGVEDTINTITFTDCENEFVILAAGMGIVNGKGDNKFAPDDLITREEAAVMLTRARKCCLYGVISFFKYSEEVFADDTELSEWAKDGVAHMHSTKIMQGVGDNKFDPKGLYTREQAITTFTRLFDDEKTADGKLRWYSGVPSYEVRATHDRVIQYYENTTPWYIRNKYETPYGTVIDVATAGIMHGSYNNLRFVTNEGESITLTKDAPQTSLNLNAPWDTFEITEDKKYAIFTYSFDEKLEYQDTVLHEKGKYTFTANLETGEVTYVITPLEEADEEDSKTPTEEKEEISYEEVYEKDGMRVTTSIFTEPENGPVNLFDEDFVSYCVLYVEDENNPQYIQFDLGDVKTVEKLALAFRNATSRTTYFDVRVSEDGVNFETVIEKRGSNGDTDHLQYFDINKNARYVRVYGYSNTFNQKWVSITEARVLVEE